jgi:DNA mismatch endonuclease (patch repair protein)
MIVRRLAHRLGYRYRLHRADLPGKPDLVFPGRRKIIFVHGCWWHGHDCKRGDRRPKANAGYWLRKIERNRARDGANQAVLIEAGWTIAVVWECEIRDAAATERLLRAFLDGDGLSGAVRSDHRAHGSTI